MKEWRETTEVLERLAWLAAQGASAVLATVVRIEGSAYRRAGAKLLVEADGASLGGVSGGCLEADVREVAAAVLRGQSARLRRYDMQADDAVLGLGLGCNGVVDVFVQAAITDANRAVRQRLGELLAGDRRFAISTVIEGLAGLGGTLVHELDGRVTGSTGVPALDQAIATVGGAALDRGESALASVSGGQVFVEVLVPPPHLVIFGAGDDARPLATIAEQAGFRLTLVDHRPATLDAVRFPRGARLVQRRPDEGLAGVSLTDDCFVVMKMHSLAHDQAWLKQVLDTPVRYIGVLGPRARTDRMLDDLGIGDSERLFGPVGLDLGAEGAEQVAVAIVAELLAVRAGRSPGHLRRRAGAIHAA